MLNGTVHTHDGVAPCSHDLYICKITGKEELCVFDGTNNSVMEKKRTIKKYFP